MKLRHTLFTIDAKHKKANPELRDDESDIDDDWIAAHEDDLAAKERDKITKKFDKENEKLVAEGEKAQSKKVLDERLAEVDENLEQLKEERTSKKCVRRLGLGQPQRAGRLNGWRTGSSRSAVRRRTRS
jgi:DNA topoisomerase-1